jgi:Zn-dependent peptidase ImmA (M78 family)/transcriptional regulator with XRE-family HTH domain
VTSEVLKWAIEESGYSAEDLAASLKLDAATVEAWITGDDRPTQGQFTKLAERLHRPKSIFFLPEPPKTGGVPPRLRSAVGRTTRQLSAAELLHVRRARRMQRLLSLLERDEHGEAVEMPDVTVTSPADIAGARLRTWLRVTLQEQRDWSTAREAFDAWRHALERRGVVVMELQLGGDGLRGFSLADDFAPLVAVNTRENLQARIFTLLHELAHLGSGTGTSCLEDVMHGPGADEVERWCDGVASAAVLPQDALHAELQAAAVTAEPDFALVREIAAKFNVSLRATAVALIRSGLAADTLYADVEEAAPTADFDKGFGRAGSQRAPKRRLNEVGPRAAMAVLRALSDHRLNELEARRYLRLDGAEIVELADEIGTSA